MGHVLTHEHRLHLKSNFQTQCLLEPPAICLSDFSCAQMLRTWAGRRLSSCRAAQAGNAYARRWMQCDRNLKLGGIVT